ncbi:MAG: hypothetical protein OEP95_00520 [Myxococcales bacterium]|nr:hypothetical protein [Myxococcales bacterium]
MDERFERNGVRRRTRFGFAAGLGLLAVGLVALAAAPARALPGDELSDECRAYREDPYADLGEVMKAGCEPTLAQMSALMDNPVGNVAMLFTQFDMFRLTNDDVKGVDAEYQYNYMGIAQFPKGISEDWNLISRVIWNVPSVPLDQGKIDDFMKGRSSFLPAGGGPSQPPSNSPSLLPIDAFGGRETGFGDMYYVGLFSPKQGIKHASGATSVWGAGFNLSFPTASEDILGDGKWSAGPSLLYVYLGKKWKVGGLMQNYFDYAGPSRRDDVAITNLQYLYYYSLNETTSIGAGPNIIINWEADSDERYTVPIGLGINKTFQIGKVPVRVGLEFHYNVIRPDTVGSQWDLRFFIIPAVPSAMFGWMQ